MLTENQQEFLMSYKDKAFIMMLLCEQSYNEHVFIKNIINIPLILVNTAMTALNSIVANADDMKIPNILLNSTTGIILGLISNFKIYEKINEFHSSYIKYNKLMNSIHGKMTNNYDDITGDFINSIVNDYDNITDNLNYGFPNKIKKRTKSQYHHMVLPLSLSVDIVTLSEECRKNTCCGGKEDSPTPSV